MGTGHEAGIVMGNMHGGMRVGVREAMVWAGKRPRRAGSGC